ncbi:MAG TPA: hypothetical protein VF552_09365 [Allosphingosinicella sp.]
MRTFLLVACALLLAGCDRADLPGWWPEALGGEPALDKLRPRPLPEPLHPRLEPLSSLGRNGLRVSISPSFGLYHFVADFIPQPLDCYIPAERLDQHRYEVEGCGMIAVRYTIFGRDQAPEPHIRRFNFHVPESEYREAVAEFDGLARRWRGGSGGMLDGTSVGVEQFREGRLRSMQTNATIGAEPNNPAAHLLPSVHRLLLAYGPAAAVPRASGFTVEAAEANDFPCMGQAFADPDPDGFGTGQDACARQMASPPRR